MKNYKFIILTSSILTVMIILTASCYIQDRHKANTNNKISISSNVNKIKDENINEDFLEWITEKYSKQSIIKLNKYLENNEYNRNVWHDITGFSYNALLALYNNNLNRLKIIDDTDDTTLSFVGDVSLADNWYIMPKYDERQKGIEGILSTEVIDTMKKSAVMVVNNEFTISNRGTPLPGKAYTFKANPRRLKIYEEMGVDLLTLANNHVYDYGTEAFNDMLDSLDEYKIPHIGAGKNIEEAKSPYYFIVNGYKIAFLNANRSEKKYYDTSSYWKRWWRL